MKPAYLHWLLGLMVVNPIPLTWIVPIYNRRHTNASPLPDFRPDAYAQLIIAALEAGLIQLESLDCPLTLENARETVITRSKRSVDEIPEEGIVIRLTEEGGRGWEQLAKPQWDKFLKFELRSLSSSTDDLPMAGLLASRNRDSVVAYLGWYEFFESVKIDWDTLKMELHSDYEATYWKRLSDVHEARFDGFLQRTDRSVPRPISDWKISLRNWHVKPWNRADWQ